MICDYATRYPEAIALRTIDAPTVGVELVKLFARMGVPEEILTNQGSNFTSQLLHEVYSCYTSSPSRQRPTIHRRTAWWSDSTVRLNLCSAKQSTRKEKIGTIYSHTYSSPNREVPQASTGFSPVELVYGRHVQGPLDVLKESWEASKRSTESVVSYVLTIQERLKKLCDIVRENLEDAQAMQKTWYNCHSRDREFNHGDEVLVLLPTSTNKLLAGWRGPYPIVRRVNRVNYEVEMTD